MTTSLGPICYKCKHLARVGDTREAAYPFQCAAFPDGIPLEIIRNEVDHRAPFTGDGGIQFEASSAHGDAYAAMIFGPGQGHSRG